MLHTQCVATWKVDKKDMCESGESTLYQNMSEDDAIVHNIYISENKHFENVICFHVGVSATENQLHHMICQEGFDYDLFGSIKIPANNCLVISYDSPVSVTFEVEEVF